MSETKLIIHASWPTLHHKPLLEFGIKKVIYNHIFDNCSARSIKVLDINGTDDHVHIVLSMHPTQNLSQVIHEIKGESSSWINKNKITPSFFKWQEDYTAVTVSPANKKNIRQYFRKQEKLHCEMTYQQEVRFILLDKIYDNPEFWVDSQAP